MSLLLVSRRAGVKHVTGTNGIVGVAAVLQSITKAIKRVIMLLSLRKLWSRLGRYDQTAPTAPAVANTFALLGRYVQGRTARLFDHLVRCKGVLKYKYKPVGDQ